MSTTKVILKKSSVIGRVPDSSSLDYGELALNYGDGRLYFKTSFNEVRNFIDSDLTLELANQSFADNLNTISTTNLNEGSNLYYTRNRSESDVFDIVDSAYIQQRQTTYDVLDSDDVRFIIDSAYVENRVRNLRGDLSLNQYNIVDSGNINIIGTITSTGDVSGKELTSTNASGDEGGQINLAKPPNATIDGGVTIDVYQNRLRFFVQGGTAKGAYIDLPSTADGVGTNLISGGVGDPFDSADAIDLIDSAYIQARQITYNFLDSAEAIRLVDSAYVNARLNRSLFLDSAEVIDLVDSAYVNARLNRSLFLDSTEAINLINVYGFDSTSFNGMFAAKSTTNLSEGTNKYYTKVRFDSDFGSKSTTNLAEGTNKYYTTARADSDAKRAISVTDAGGDGSISYNNTTGIITYTGPSATEVRAHFTNGTGVTISSGQISIGQNVSTTSDVTFGKVTVDSAVVDALYLERKAILPSTAAGTLYWDSDPQKGLSFISTTNEGNTSTTINIGQSSLIYVHNLTGEIIPIGTAVYISGTAHGAHPSVSKAKADNAATARAVGLTTMELVDNAHGYVSVLGLVRNVNTGGMTPGQDLYLSKDSAGKFTNIPVTVQQGYPFHIGKVIRADSNTGSILVNPYSEHYEYLKIQDDLVVDSSITASTVEVGRHIHFTPVAHASAPVYQEGLIYYNQDAHTFEYYVDFDSQSGHLQIGEKEWVRAHNNSGAVIKRGQPVYTTGVDVPGDPVHGRHPTIALADASNFVKKDVLGLAMVDIANGADGLIQVRGVIDNLNTSNLTANDRFHLGITPGTLVGNAPDYPNFPTDLGRVLVVDSDYGTLYINIVDHTMETLRISENARIDGNLTIGGNLNVVGTTTNALVQDIDVSSNFLKLLNGDTLGTAYQNFNPGGLNDAIFTGSYRGDSSLFYFIDIVSTDSTGDVIRFGISDSDTIAEGQYGAAFDSAGSGKVTWNLLTDGLIAPLRNNISITFINATGHSDSDLWSAHPTELNLDLGFVGNYNPPGAGGIKYAGLYRDVNDGRWRFFDGLTQNLDSSVVEISDSNGFTLSNVQANIFYGALSGNATTATSATQLATARTFSLTGDITATGVTFDGTGNVQLTTDIASGTIVNADINASAAIADSKLATISTAGKVQNSATTATDANTGSAIVARDVSGNFSAGTITTAALDTATTASHYFIETASDGAIRPKTLANVRTEIVTTAAVNSAAATTVGTVTSGTWSASFGAVSGANLTNLTAGNLSGTIPSGVLGNSSLFVGTTSIALNRGSANLGLTGITSIAMPGATSGTITVTPAATAGTTAITIPATTGTLITSGDNGTVTSTMIANNTIVSADFNSATSLIIYNSAGTALKTIYSPGS
jgi:hypothetical protein